jgi:dipeptide/tripeptide permease
MIQRKQSIWLLIAALLNAGVFYFDLYKYHAVINGVDTPAQLRVSDHFPTLLIALVMTLLPLVTIFMFRNRKRQITLSVFSIIAISGFITMALQRTKNLNAVPASESYWIGSVLPIAAIVFLFMAILGIRKDDKLVKSTDRLR